MSIYVIHYVIHLCRNISYYVLSQIIGSFTYDERPQGVMKAGKASNSHDTIFWATTYARWCLRNKGSKAHIENMCNIFDILATLNSARIKVEYVTDVLKPMLIDLLIERAGLLPPSECMLTLRFMSYYTFVIK